MSVGQPNLRPWLSVIMPSHRGERWIDAALRSIATETVDGIEILLIDSSDTPVVREIAQTYSKRYRIRIFERPDLLSWNTKTNFGVEMADSDHVSWLGVDDLWLPGRSAAARRWIANAAAAPLHFAPSAIIDKNGRRLGVWRCPLPAERALESTFVTERLLVQNFVAAPAPIFRKDAWLRCGGLDETLWYTADWDVWLKLAACAPTYYHNDVTIGFRIHAGALTMTGVREIADFRLQMQAVVDRHLSRMGSSSTGLGRVARASIIVNAALASASVGNFSEVFRAVSQVALLGPSGTRRYLRDSRIIERVLPRIRAKIARRL